MSGDHKTVIKGNPSQYVKLNIGGSLHYTTIGTLTKHDTMLRAMFSGRMEVLTDSEGWILIDRCGKHFGTILNFLRDGSTPLPEGTRAIAELLAEAKYYCIADLAEFCEKVLSQKGREAEPICRVPLITSHKEEQLLITNSIKPVVKLLINRHNNKYSYTTTSDDNLLKNIELFDRLSLRFNGRVLFIKDVIGSSEICCWSFYGHGKKVAEVCCTSIVYATDKKHTKVDFPEARIYEETLNILLYENRTGPDQELMQATSTRGAVTAGMSAYTSDEEEERSGLARSKGLKACGEFLTHYQRKTLIMKKPEPFTYRIIEISRFISGINAWDEKLSNDIIKKIENHWKTKIPEKKFDEKNVKNKLYILSMFPYPSGYLHMGHVKIYGTSDVLARYFRMKGENVLHPMGWDAFGLPAENAALEKKVNPETWTQENIASMKEVMEELNFSFDWDREFATCDSDYYKWTQFFFIKLFERGLAYRKEELVNWDPVDKTVLADEQVDVTGRSWRSGALVEKKMLRQWFIRTTAFAESLLEGLEDPLLKGWDDIIDIQKNWIGEIDGTVIKFEIVNSAPVSKNEIKKIPIWMNNPEYIDKAKFVAIKTNSFWTFGCSSKDFLIYKVKNPFTNELLPVYQTNSVSFPEGVEVRLGFPELNEKDKEFADFVGVQYSLEKQNLASEEELKDLRENICAEARERGIGGHPASSKLKDWLISRQRYWGTPIPIVYCQNCGEQPVSEEDLPVRLPAVNSVTVGANPLVEQADWLNTFCPKCGGKATRESDTMDTFVDSSWYYLRFIDPDNAHAACKVEKIKNLMPVDIYVGGKEHATLHLFYARFMNHFLHSLGVVPHREPFARFLSQGVVKGLTYKSEKTGRYVDKESVVRKDGICFHTKTGEVLIEDWEKMSKSKNNSVKPMKLIAEYGVDLTRMVILGASSPKSEMNWNKNLFNDIFQWQRRLWLTISNFIKLRSLNSIKPEETEMYKELDFYIFDSRNFYLQKIMSLIENSLNTGTALRKLQGLTNSLRKCPDDIITHSLHFERALAVQIILLAPFAPYFASELWAGFTKASNRLCVTGEILWNQSVFHQPWPQVDSNYQAFSETVEEISEKSSVLQNSILAKVKKSKENRKKKLLKKKI